MRERKAECEAKRSAAAQRATAASKDDNTASSDSPRERSARPYVQQKQQQPDQNLEVRRCLSLAPRSNRLAELPSQAPDVSNRDRVEHVRRRPGRHHRLVRVGRTKNTPPVTDSAARTANKGCGNDNKHRWGGVGERAFNKRDCADANDRRLHGARRQAWLARRAAPASLGFAEAHILLKRQPELT